MSDSFIFFGCWNNINCDKEAIYRDVVLNCIKEFESAVNNMFIAGDNWYNTSIKLNDKETHYKYYLVDTLVSGYHILYSMNKNIYICVGNHDESVSNTENPNCMINTQKHYIKKLRDFINDKTKAYDQVASASANTAESLPINKDGFLELQIKQLLDEALPNIEDLDISDTDNTVMKLYSGENIGVCEDVSTFYKVIIINTNILSSAYLATLRKQIMDVRKKFLNCKIFVMGHIPLFYDKHKDAKPVPATQVSATPVPVVKEDKTKLKKGLFDSSEALIDELYNVMADTNCIYLCADCHNFNIMKIKKGDKCVIQITAGTGGADPDIIKDLKEKKVVNYADVYDITYYSINSYGYCKITVSNDSVVVSYNKIIAADCSNKSIDELYEYKVINNDIEYMEKEKEKEKIKKNIILKASKNKQFYCDRVGKYSSANDDAGREQNVIKSKDPKKGVCYKKSK